MLQTIDVSWLYASTITLPSELISECVSVGAAT